MNYRIILFFFTWMTGSSTHVHAATLLDSHKATQVHQSSNVVTITEIYDPLVDQWTTTASMAMLRIFHTATLLNSGKVLVAGSGGYTGYTATCELYDPLTSRWHAAANMTIPRGFHTATLLKSGQVLVTGGSTYDMDGALNSCEIYDPLMDKWSPTGSMATPRSSHTATLLNSGKVLVTSDATTSEIYDPSTGRWSFLTSMGPEARYNPTATLLKSSRVLLIGGIQSARYSTSSEIYDP
ncbi:unnamed protein product [Rotaria sp. Silwood2]|nr:unnamed protein product [Rotaria sp. Silwood2]CAF4189011.1 unnamed protein product [Rotaria sp. Silwood2]